jgi:hypothetical protein
VDMSTRSVNHDHDGDFVVILDPDDGAPVVIIIPGAGPQTGEPLPAHAARATPAGKPS